MSKDFIATMRERELVQQIVHEEEFSQYLQSGSRIAYVGFDPTSDSLHVGSLMPLMAMAHWCRSGHKVIAVVGGGTAMIGDPSGKTELRNMMNEDMIRHNAQCIEAQIRAFLEKNAGEKAAENFSMMNNADWLLPLNYLDFLRRIGSQFSVNRMLTAECFKQRLEKGLSFLEFNYMLLQAYDFLMLFEKKQCAVQFGGDDQWSNLLAGMDLIRRFHSKPAFCLTVPLLTTSSGKKMGKTESGAIWLDKNKTSVFEFFQYWRNIADEDVLKVMQYLTFIPIDQVNQLKNKSGADLNKVKEDLAFEITKSMHGENEAKHALDQTKALFGGGVTLDPEQAQPTNDISADLVARGLTVVDVLHLAGITPSKGEAKRLVEQGGIFINGEKVIASNQSVTQSDFEKNNDLLLIKKGKKNFYKVKLS